jgi:acyl dehydratase
MSVFLTKNRQTKKKSPPVPDRVHLKQRTAIHVPAGTGRKYAAVSKDYNPHHLFNLTARPFGFKRAIAHGMWSVGRVLAALNELDILADEPLQVDCWFKRPVFMPADLTTGRGISFS